MNCSKNRELGEELFKLRCVTPPTTGTPATLGHVRRVLQIKTVLVEKEVK
jgi:ribosomal protein L29